MKRIIAKFKGLIQIVGEFFTAVLFIACVIVVFYSFCKWVIEPLSPIITSAFVLLGTGKAMETRITGVISFAGLALYGLSWPIHWAWGVWPGVITCLAGILLWFWALAWAISPPTRILNLKPAVI